MINAGLKSKVSRWLVAPDLELEASLRAAALAGVLGITAALITCLALLGTERRPFGLGAALLLASVYALALPVYLLVPIVVVLLWLAYGTVVIFSADEKRRLREYWRRKLRIEN